LARELKEAKNVGSAEAIVGVDDVHQNLAEDDESVNGELERIKEENLEDDNENVVVKSEKYLPFRPPPALLIWLGRRCQSRWSS